MEIQLIACFMHVRYEKPSMAAGLMAE